MENTKPIKYEFKQIERGLTAFVGNFEKKLNEIYSDIPILILDSGDESYFFREKFQETKEKYLQVPRVIIAIDSVEFQTDQDTNQYTKIIYRFNDENYRSQIRRKATNLPIIINLVCSNFIKALEYLEVIGSILSLDNTFTYHHLGNDYQGNYNLTSMSMEKNSMDIGSGTKNYVIKANIDLILQLFFVNFSTIEKLGFGGQSMQPGGYDINGNYVGGYDINGNPIEGGQYNQQGQLVGIYDGNGNQINSGNINGTDVGSGLKPIFNIESENNIETYLTKLDPTK